MNKPKPKIIAIVGPTASGKTGIGVQLAKDFDGEIISADSRQVFRGLDLGTGKDLDEYKDVKYHLIDIKDPGESFNLFDFLAMARDAIDDILNRGKVPIIVGGTGLYIQGLTEGFDLAQKLGDQGEAKLYSREQLNNKTVEELQEILAEIDEEVLLNLADKQNPHRLIRAIERSQEGFSMTRKKPEWDILQIGLFWPREVLNEKIDRRVDERFDQGMLGETENLLKSGVDVEWLHNLGLEYKVMTNFLISNSEFLVTNKIPEPKFEISKYSSFEEMKNALKVKTHQYAKRQMTWFKRFPEIVWENDYSNIKEKVEVFLKK